LWTGQGPLPRLGLLLWDGYPRLFQSRAQRLRADDAIDQVPVHGFAGEIVPDGVLGIPAYSADELVDEGEPSFIVIGTPPTVPATPAGRSIRRAAEPRPPSSSGNGCTTALASVVGPRLVHQPGRTFTKAGDSYTLAVGDVMVEVVDPAFSR
jgi:hypothetical protein